MNPPSTRTVRVAAVQVESKHGCNEINRQHATAFIEQAARAGAQLIVLPELFASGYMPNETLWDAAEPPEGQTITWLKKTAQRLGVYLGAGLVETDGKDFLNIFVLAAPDGTIAGRAQKANAEANCFKRGRGSHIVDTSLGKLGIGICADTHFIAFAKLMQRESIALLLMPHAWPTPYTTTRLVSEQDRQEQYAKTKQLPHYYAQLLGVPVIFVNQVGSMGRLSGFLGRIMKPEIFRLEGRSRIVDSDGTLKGELEAEEGLIIADVTLGRARQPAVEPKSYGGWIDPGSALARKIIIPLDILFGRLRYTLSSQRRRKARGIYARR
jgi:predicted amidohydrolase